MGVDEAQVGATTAVAGVPLIRLTGVDKTFRRRGQEIEALRDVSLDVAQGEFVAVLGPSGCGKTTLLRVIGGLHDVTAGHVEVDRGPPARARAAKHFGLVPQAPALVPWKTLGDNVRFLSDLRPGVHTPMGDADIEQLVRTVGLERFTRSYPHELSGGMQQRAALVRAFALGAPILLMDEPFAALDEITRADMRYLLLDLWRQRRGTVVFVTHSVTEAVILSDRVVVMAARPGRIRASYPIGLARPRRPAMEDSAEFHAHVREIRAELRSAHGTVGRDPDAS